MTVASRFSSWQVGRKPGAPYTRCSPNLKAIADHLIEHWKMTNLGCYGVRPIRGGTAWSSHAFGAAVDLGYTSRSTITGEVIPFLIGHSAELGIQRIHDYAEKRYWQAGKGWIMRPPGDGGNWLHIETYVDNWDDGRTVDERLGTVAPVSNAYPGRVVKRGSTGKTVQRIQAALGVTTDGKFGEVTETAVKAFQKAHHLEVDGIVGPKTWAALFA